MKDLTLNAPENKKDLTKENMLAYIKKADKADKKWFVELMNAHKIKKVNNLTGAVVEGYDMPKIREAFAQKYFPSISAKNKKKPCAKKATFEEELEALLK